MTTKAILTCFSVILFASAIVLAEESSTEIAAASNSSESAPANDSSHAGPPQFPAFGPGHPPSRHKRSPEQHQEKAAPRRAACSVGSRGSKCRSCNEVIQCLPSGRAIIRRCSGASRYCNRGRCSATPGGKCRTTTTSSSSSPDTSTTSSSSTSTSSDSTSSTASTTSTASSSSSTSSTSTTTEAEDYSE
ncbi:hypothetical protein O3G_MSEX002790 [Manduca sexta]|uniref:Uncharacterized protein n=1 Tax=Manduca sexta TaxID=7130 RepID=A0A921YQQ3_MANSE|nr:hypothetical protein O3G_MSEX002790 [Manduca sexta]